MHILMCAPMLLIAVLAIAGGAGAIAVLLRLVCVAMTMPIIGAMSHGGASRDITTGVSRRTSTAAACGAWLSSTSRHPALAASLGPSDEQAPLARVRSVLGVRGRSVHADVRRPADAVPAHQPSWRSELETTALNGAVAALAYAAGALLAGAA